jgi:hypothetical protein
LYAKSFLNPPTAAVNNKKFIKTPEELQITLDKNFALTENSFRIEETAETDNYLFNSYDYSILGLENYS